MAKDQLIDRARLLAEFDMMTEEAVAELLDITVLSLRNRPRSKQPPFTKVGRARLFPRKGVVDYLAAGTVTASSPPMRHTKTKARTRRKAITSTKPRTKSSTRSIASTV